MPCGAHSPATDLVNATMPALAAAECDTPGAPVHAYVATMLSTAPGRDSAISRRATAVEKLKQP